MTRRRIFIFAIIFIAILCGIAFWRARHLQFDVRRIVLISIDTCRADHLGCYGYQGDTMPNLDRIARQGKIADAIEHFHRGVKVEPDHFLGHYNLAKALHAQGNLGQALVHYRKAVTLDPGSPGANYRYANALVASGRLETALKHYRTALKLDDDLAPAHNDLSWLLATRADSEVVDPQAVLKHARRAAELTKYRDPGILDTLAVAQAACGQFGDAVETAHKALAITTGAKAEELAAQITSRLKLYEKQIPYREEEVAAP